MGVLGILAVQGLCSVAIIRYFLTHGRDGYHSVKTVIAPILGFLSMAGACYLLIENRAFLSGAGTATYIKLLPWVVLVVFLIGCATALYMRGRTPDRYRKIGRFDARGGRRGDEASHEHLGHRRVLHPLEPLTAEEISAASEILKSEQGLGDGARFVFITPARAAQGGRAGGRDRAAGGLRRPLRPPAAGHVRGGRLAGRPPCRRLGAHRGRAAADHVRGVHGLRGARPAPTRAGRRRCAGAGIEDFSLAMVDPWAAGYTDERGRPERAPDPAPAHLGALGAGRERLCAPDRGPDRGVRPRPHEGGQGRRPRRRAAAAQGRATTTPRGWRRRTTSRASPRLATT